jgi:hypothetical protein
MLHHLPESSPLPPLRDPGRKLGMSPTMLDSSQRPLGVTLLSLLNFLSAGVFIFLAASALLTHSTRVEGVFFGIMGAVINLPIAIGLWMLRRWARVMALIMYIAAGTLTLCANFNNAITGSELLGLAISAAGTRYLLQPETERAFSELPTE